MEKRAWTEIDIKKISSNIDKIKDYTGKMFMACVKGNCYGMGMCEISRKIEDTVDFFGVATALEALTLRNCGIGKPILVMGPVLPEDIEELAKNDIRIVLFEESTLETAAKVARKINKKTLVHIKIDTGLGRIGIRPDKAKEFIFRTAEEKGIAIEGLFSHFATADWQDTSYARKQLNLFTEVVNSVSKIKIPFKHIANSPSIFTLPDAFKNFDMIRIGLLICGVYPDKRFSEKLPLECALKGYCRINYIKNVPHKTYLSYGITYKTEEDSTKIATLGIGYADGLRRSLSNNFYMRWKGEKIKIVGNICMDQTLVDVTGKDVKIGDVIQIFGDKLTIEEMAVIADTVPQEILCGFGSSRMEKIYIEKDGGENE